MKFARRCHRGWREQGRVVVILPVRDEAPGEVPDAAPRVVPDADIIAAYLLVRLLDPARLPQPLRPLPIEEPDSDQDHGEPEVTFVAAPSTPCDIRDYVKVG